MRKDEEDLIGIDRRTEMETVFSQHLPRHCNVRTQRISVQKLAKALGMTRQAVNYWFAREKLPHQQITKLTKLPGSTLTLEILFPFSVSE